MVAVPRQFEVKVRERTRPEGLVERSKEARRLLEACCFCERRCGVNRLAGELGWCRCGHATYSFSEGILWNEETFITPTYALFYAGCNLSCSFCYAGEENRAPSGRDTVVPEEVARRVTASEIAPATFSFIGGEPTVHTHTSLALAAVLPASLPLVWNSNFYFSAECARLLDNIVDVYIADLHFGNETCARLIASVDRYLPVLEANLQWAAVAGALVVRHLLLPGHFECCTRPALEWMAHSFPGVPTNLLANYLPPESRVMGGLGRSLQPEEVALARQLAGDLGMEVVT